MDHAFHAAFNISPADTLCVNRPVSFANSSSGNNIQYHWNFGDNSSFNGSNPPSHVYFTGNGYSVILNAVNDIGCLDSSNQSLTITSYSVVDFTNPAISYCTGDKVKLAVSLNGNIVTYAWNNGDGLIVQNKPLVSFIYSAERNYSITLSAKDRFCGDVSRSKAIMVYQMPLVKLGNDTSLCPGETISIGIPSSNGYTYQWNTGAHTPMISTIPLSKLYTLDANNHGCIASDAMIVEVKASCLIRVPSAFTPNADGLNDRLKTINAERTLNFSFKIFNRYGQIVFSTEDPREGWME